jgi:pimeloyl-ACP methyl ester carboxylesterase
MFRKLLFVVVSVVLVTTAALSEVDAQDPAWELTETEEFTTDNFGFTISYPAGWLTTTDGSSIVFNELETDHQVALGGPFATEGYSVSFVYQKRNDLREYGLPSSDPGLQDLLAVNHQQYGYQDPVSVSESTFLTWPALRVETVDGMGNHVSAVQGFYGINRRLGLRAFTFMLAAPSAESLDAFLPTWEAMLESITISAGTIGFGDNFVQLECSGEGSPTVILEPNIGFVTWDYIQGAVEEFTRVCSHTWPSEGPGGRTSTFQEYADNLHTLLVTVNASRPYILVGPYAGGFLVRVYADRYPDDVAGMVLVGSFHPNVYVRQREVNLMVMTEEEADNVYQASMQELVSYGVEAEVSLEQVAATGPFGNLPLVVLTPEDSGYRPLPPFTDETASLWHRIWTDELQPDLATLSANSTLIIIEDATHRMMPNHRAVADAIQQMVEDIRTEGD